MAAELEVFTTDEVAVLFRDSMKTDLALTCEGRKGACR